MLSDRGEKGIAKALKLKRDNLWKSNWKDTHSFREICNVPASVTCEGDYSERELTGMEEAARSCRAVGTSSAAPFACLIHSRTSLG